MSHTCAFLFFLSHEHASSALPPCLKTLSPLPCSSLQSPPSPLLLVPPTSLTQAVLGRIVSLKFEQSAKDGSLHGMLELTSKARDLQDLDLWENK